MAKKMTPRERWIRQAQIIRKGIEDNREDVFAALAAIQAECEKHPLNDREQLFVDTLIENPGMPVHTAAVDIAGYSSGMAVRLLKKENIALHIDAFRAWHRVYRLLTDERLDPKLLPAGTKTDAAAKRIVKKARAVRKAFEE